MYTHVVHCWKKEIRRRGEERAVVESSPATHLETEDTHASSTDGRPLDSASPAFAKDYRLLCKHEARPDGPLARSGPCASCKDQYNVQMSESGRAKDVSLTQRGGRTRNRLISVTRGA